MIDPVAQRSGGRLEKGRRHFAVQRVGAYARKLRVPAAPRLFLFLLSRPGGLQRGRTFRRRLSISGQVGHARSRAPAGGAGPAGSTTSKVCVRGTTGLTGRWLGLSALGRPS